MFIGGGVEDYLRLVCPEGEVESRNLADVADYRDEVEIRVVVFEFEAEVVHRGLGVVEEDEPLDAEAGELAAEFGADGAGGTGHHDHFVLEVLDDLFHRDLDFISAEEVFDLDFSRTDYCLAFHHFVYRRHDEAFDAPVGAYLYKTVFFGLGVGFFGEEYRVDAIVGEYCVDVVFIFEVDDRELVDHSAFSGAARHKEAEHFVVRG